MGTGIKRLSKLNNLEILDIHGNMLGNNILSHLDGFTSLKSLRLQNCGLKGSVNMIGRFAFKFFFLLKILESLLGASRISKVIYFIGFEQNSIL